MEPIPQNIHTLVSTFLAKLGISVTSIDVVEVPAHPVYNIRTDDAKRLIGPQGDHLRALNTVVRKIVDKQISEDAPKFLLDVNGYHQDRIRDLEVKARLLADRVRTFRSSAEMTPMNAYERMLIHAMFSEDPEVTTESDGEGKSRHVVLRYRA